MLTPRAFFASDTGLRFIQIQAFTHNGGTSAAIPYPQETYDPTFEHVPYYVAYALHNQQIYLSVSSLFPFFASLFYKSFGWYGMIIPLVVGGVLTGLGTFLLAQSCRVQRPHLWLWLSVFGTPVLFYTVQIWDHALATGLMTLGLGLTAVALIQSSGWKLALGGLLIALTFGQRPEMGVLALAGVVSLFVIHWRIWQQLWPLTVGGGVGTAVVALLNLHWQGHLLGFPLANNLLKIGVPEQFPALAQIRATRPALPPAIERGRFLFHVDGRDPITFTATLCILIAILLLFFGLRIPKYQKRQTFYAGLGFVGLAFILLTVTSWQQPILGLLSTFPFLPLSLVFVPRKKEESHHVSAYTIYTWLFATSWLTIILMLLLWPSYGGRQWGTRYMLSVYPLLLVMAAFTIDRYGRELKRPLSTTLNHLTIGLALISVLFQLAGLRLLYQTLNFEAAFVSQIHALDVEIVFTSDPFLRATLGALDERDYFYVNNNDELRDLLNVALAQDVAQIAIIETAEAPLRPPERLGNGMVQPSGSVTFVLIPDE